MNILIKIYYNHEWKTNHTNSSKKWLEHFKNQR